MLGLVGAVFDGKRLTGKVDGERVFELREVTKEAEDDEVVIGVEALVVVPSENVFGIVSIIDAKVTPTGLSKPPPPFSTVASCAWQATGKLVCDG